jgi:hypothetical protein
MGRNEFSRRGVSCPGGQACWQARRHSLRREADDDPPSWLQLKAVLDIGGTLDRDHGEVPEASVGACPPWHQTSVRRRNSANGAARLQAWRVLLSAAPARARADRSDLRRISPSVSKAYAKAQRIPGG